MKRETEKMLASHTIAISNRQQHDEGIRYFNNAWRNESPLTPSVLVLYKQYDLWLYERDTYGEASVSIAININMNQNISIYVPR